MALLDEDLTWSFANGSMSLLDFIDNDDKENNSTFIFNEPLLQIPTDAFKDDIFDLLSIDDFCPLSPTKPTAAPTYTREVAPPSYNQSISDYSKTIKTEEDFSFEKLNISSKDEIKTEPITHIKSEFNVLVKSEFSADLEALRATTSVCNFGREEQRKLKYGMNSSSVSAESFSYPSSLPAVKPLTHNIEVIFQKEDSMSISLDDITSIISNNQELADSLSPISPNSISSEGSSETLISSGLSDFEGTSPKRAPLSGPTKKPRRRKATDSTNSPHLWQFILELLGDTVNRDVIAWTGLEHHFKVHNSRELARLWGMRKNKPRMNFDKLSRAMRYYYDKNIIRHIPGQRLVYKFCRNNDDTVYTRLLTDASRTIPLLPLVTCTAHNPSKLPGKSFTSPKKFASLPPQTSYNMTPTTDTLTKSIKDAFSEQQHLSSQERYYTQQQLQQQQLQQSCYNHQQRQQHQLQMQQRQQEQMCQQIQQQQLQTQQQLHLQQQIQHQQLHQQLPQVNQQQQMQYQPLQHYSQQQQCFDSFYNVLPEHPVTTMYNGIPASQPVSTPYTYDTGFYQPY